MGLKVGFARQYAPVEGVFVHIRHIRHIDLVVVTSVVVSTQIIGLA
jgi:hypothetical protein